MPEERKYWGGNDFRLNADDSGFALGINEIVNGENIRTSTTDAGVTAVVESIGSNVLISQPAPSVTYITIGNEPDIENQRILKFQYNTTGSEHKIVCLFTDTELEYDVLRSSQVIGSIGTSSLVIAFQGNTNASHAAFTLAGSPNVGDIVNVFWATNPNPTDPPNSYNVSSTFLIGWSLSDMITDLFNKMVALDSNTTLFSSGGNDGVRVHGFSYATISVDTVLVSQITGGLNFSKDHPIHSARIIGGLLEWTDDFNEPKKINIDKALKANNPSLQLNVIPYVLPMVYPTQTIIKRPPYYPLEAEKSFDGASSNTNNYINDQAFQMLYFYEFCDFEWSKLSAYSPLIPYGPTDYSDENFVTCKVPFAEPIDDDVQKVYICAKYGNTGKTSVVHIFDKAIAADAAAIAAHNAGTTQLTFLFYNNEVPIGLDDVQSNTPFDRVPLLAEALEVARDRNFLGNILVGYDTPKATSLTGIVVTVGGGGGTFSGEWGYVTLSANFTPPGAQNVYMYPFVFIASGAPQNFYYFPAARVNSNWYGGVWIPDITALSNLDINDSTFAGNTEASFVNVMKIFSYPSPTSGATVGTPPWLAGYAINYDFFGTSYPVSVIQFPPSSNPNFFKSNGTYNIAITFYDRFRRKSAIVNKLIQLIIPQRTLTQTDFSSSIQWFLDNTNALNEIPDWAYYYMINITKNLTTRFFLQGQVNSGGYAVRAQDGTFTYSTTLNLETQYAVAFDLTPLFAIGMGYSFTPGDKINVFLSSLTLQNLPILGVDGNNVLFQLTDVGTFPIAVSYEIFTPYIPAENEPFYETNLVYPINNPATSNRAYSTLSDVLQGDTYNIERTLNSVIFIAETMSPNDRFWQIWQTNSGWINLPSTLGQKRLKDQIAFSSVRIQDTQVNGLSEFLALNTKTIPEDCGGIEKLILSSKVEGEQGTVMLAICAGGQTASLYMGEVRITDSTGATQFLGTSTDVIGTINILKGDRGTLNPESVCEYRGDIRWWDVDNGVWVQYSINGLDDIVDKMTRFWSLWALKFKSLSSTEIEALGGRPFVFSVVDPKHKELLISIPKLSNDPPKGYLSDYPSTIYPFDILDYQAKIIVYKLGMAGRLPHYQGAFTFYAENFCAIENKLYSFHSGLTYRHNSTASQNNFYGVQYASKIMFVSNQIPNVPKSYNNIEVEANVQPFFVYFYNQYPYLQSSDLVDFDPNWRNFEGIFKATLYRNKLSTGVLSYGLLTGEKMRNTAMFVMMQFNVTSVPLQLNFAQLSYEISLGHTNQLTR